MRLWVDRAHIERPRQTTYTHISHDVMCVKFSAFDCTLFACIGVPTRWTSAHSFVRRDTQSTRLCDGKMEFCVQPLQPLYARLVPKTKEEYVKFGCVRMRCIEFPKRKICCWMRANQFVASIQRHIDCAPLYALRAEKSTCNISSSLISHGLSPTKHSAFRSHQRKCRSSVRRWWWGRRRSRWNIVSSLLQSDAIITSRHFM